MAQTLSAISSVLDKYIIPARNLINQASVLWNRLEKTAKKFKIDKKAGRVAWTPIVALNERGVGARKEEAALPTPDKLSYAQPYLDLSYHYGRLKVTGPAYEAGVIEGRGETWRDEVEAVARTIKENVARQLFGDGSGKLAQCIGAGNNATTVTVNTTRNLRKNMYIDIYDGDTQKVDSVKITAVDKANNQITISAASTWTDGSYIYREDSKDAEMTGLLAAIDDGTFASSYAHLSRATYDVWKSPVKIVNYSELDEEAINELLDEIDTNGADPKIDLIVGPHRFVRGLRKYYKDKSYPENYMELNLGHRGLIYDTPKWGAVPVIADKYCGGYITEIENVGQVDIVYFLDTSTLKIAWTHNFDWARGPNGEIVIDTKAVGSDYDYKMATMYAYLQLVCTAPNNNGVLILVK